MNFSSFVKCLLYYFCRVLKSKQAEDIYFEQRGNIKENEK